MSGSQIWLCLFTFRPIASKQLFKMAWLQLINISWPGGAVVTRPIWVQGVPRLIPGSGKGFYIWFFVLLLLCFYFFLSKTHYLSQKFAISFTMLIYLVCLTYSKICDRL